MTEMDIEEPTLARSPSDDDAEPVLPNELILSIMELLVAAKCKRTLLELMLADRNKYFLGLSQLYRKLAFGEFQRPNNPSKRGIAPREFKAAFLEDSLNSGKFSFTKNITVFTRDDYSDAVPTLLGRAGPTLECLRIGIQGSVEEHPSPAWLTLAAMKNLRRLEIVTLPKKRPNKQAFNSGASCHPHLFSILAQLTELQHLELHDAESIGLSAVSRYCESWPAAIGQNPEVAKKLVKIDGVEDTDVAAWRAVELPNVKEMRLYNFSNGDFVSTDSFPGLRKVRVENVGATRNLVNWQLGDVEEIEFRGCSLDCGEQDFAGLLAWIPKRRISIVLGVCRFNGYGQTARWEAERGFWESVDCVTVVDDDRRLRHR